MLDTTSLMSITYKSFTCHHFPCRLSGVHLKTQELLAHKTQCNNSECGEETGDNTTLTTMRTAAAWLPPNITTGNKGENTEFSHKHRYLMILLQYNSFIKK